LQINLIWYKKRDYWHVHLNFVGTPHCMEKFNRDYIDSQIPYNFKRDKALQIG